ncbi:vWA domain-containing protein [Caminibacter sp.]
MNIEYPLAFLIIPIYIICKLFCPIKSEALIFPNATFFKKTKYKISLIELIFISLFAIALSSPIKTTIINSQKKGYDIVTVLDTSGSMAEYHKLNNAKRVILEFAKKRKNDRLGLVIFGNIAYIASPLTYDKKSFEEILKRIFVSIAGGRTALYDAIFLASNLFKNSEAKEKIMIVITDGVDNESITPIDVVIKSLKKKHIKVYTIGLGPNADTAVLAEIAKKTGGKFYYLNDFNKLKEVFKDINSLEKSNISSKIIKKEYFFIYPLSLGILFYLLFLYRFRRSIWSF